MTATILDHLNAEVAESLMSMGDTDIDDMLLREHDAALEQELTENHHRFANASVEHVLFEDDENVIDLEVLDIEVNQHLAEIKAHQVNPFTNKPSMSAPIGYDLPALGSVVNLADHAIVVDPASEALIEVPCAGGCGEMRAIDPTAEIPEEYAGMPRAAVCRDCARKYAAGKSGHVIRTTQVAKHQPRLTCTKEELASADSKRVSKEEPMIDLNKITDAQLGAMVRPLLLTDKAVTVSKAAEDVQQATAKVQEQTETVTVAVVEVSPLDPTTERKVEALMNVKGWTEDQARAKVAEFAARAGA